MTAPAPDLARLARVSARIGLLSFGGPAAQIALMHREYVEEHGWLSEDEFLSALSFAMLLPGPEAMQLATYAGWKLHGVKGGLIAGGLFVLPGAAVIVALAAAYAAWGQVPLVAALFLGIKAAVIVIVVEALLRVASRALLSPWHWALAGLSFVAIFAFALPFPLIIAAAALAGAALGGAKAATPPLPRPQGTLRTIAIWATLWGLPVLALWLADQRLLTELAAFFSKLAVVTFGGAYAVLAYMTQEVVEARAWITTPQMIDALGLAETTPGPLILVTVFVGFLTGHGAGGAGLALAAAMVTLWVTFVPCFLWIFAGAPYLGWITARPRLKAALSGITAAVVGVILNLSVWFAAHVFFARVDTVTLGPLRLIRPDPATLDPVVLGLALLAGYTLLIRHWPLWQVLFLSALAGAGAGVFA
jgi:chromate transporter